MKGATALDCEKTISSPNSTKTITTGISQYFFSSRRNCQNSTMTRFLATSVHPLVMIGSRVTGRSRRPAWPARACPSERIPSDDAPDPPHGCEESRESRRQQHPRVHVAEHVG